MHQNYHITKNILSRNGETCIKNSGRINHKMQVGLNGILFMSLLNCRHGGFDNTTQDERNAVPSQQQCNGHFVLYQSPVQIRGV